MAINLETLIDEVGLGSLPEEDKKSLKDHFYETLEMNVGVRLAEKMTEQQTIEFEEYYKNKDEQGAFQWLETNFPNYKEIVQEEYDKLKDELVKSVPQILAGLNK